MSSQPVGIAHLPAANQAPVKQDAFVPSMTLSHKQGNVIFRLVKPRDADVYVDCHQPNVINPTTKQLDTVRLLKGVYTIWKSEQDKQNITEKYAEKNRRNIKFSRGIAIIPADDITALEALRVIPFNIESAKPQNSERFSFFEYNANKEAEAQLNKRKQKREAVKLASNQDESKMRKHAAFLGINLFNEYGMPKSEQMLRNEYEDFAELHTDRFMKTINSGEVELSYLIKTALSDSKIDIRENSLYWANGGFICKMPSNRKPSEYLLEFALFPTEQGKQFLEQLNQIVG